MHLTILLVTIAIVCGLRSLWRLDLNAAWIDRWQRTLVLFLLPPLLLFSSAIAMIWMGPFGRMVWMAEGWLTYDLALTFIGFITIYLLNLAINSYRTLQKVRAYPLSTSHDLPVRIVEAIAPYSAQIGFWQPELIVTQGLLDLLDSAHLKAVLAHEIAHYRYRDTFWFFWLGWVRRVTAWLPQTEAMWQELLSLREVRADRWASQQTDPLLVAEALITVLQNSMVYSEPFCVAFNNIAPVDRLTQRIEALMNIESTSADYRSTMMIEKSIDPRFYLYLLLTLLPLAIVPFHH
jgi:Zn-dependent protease with chaperone function